MDPLRYADRERERFLAELIEFLRIPSISGPERYAEGVRQCAEWLARHLVRIGMERVEVIATNRHPLVAAQWRRAAGKPTVLVYGHYDVQPVEPLTAWRTDPFSPTVIGDDLFARGASDDKGQLFCHVKALEAWLATAGWLPVNVVCLFDGEEEIGSPGLAEVLPRRRADLAADLAVVSDTRMLGPGRPALVHALRGGLSLEIEVRAAPHDLHAGTFGGITLDPAQTICEIVAGLCDDGPRVAVPGFYRSVRPMADGKGHSDADLTAAADGAVMRSGAESPLADLATAQPALIVTSLTAGHQGPGFKSVVPARASVKLNFRLVPDQSPDDIEELVRAHLCRTVSPRIPVRVRRHSAADPVVLHPSKPALRAAVRACRGVFGCPPELIRSGGSIPAVGMFQRHLNLDPLLMGFGLLDDRMHAPNEKLHLPNFFNGIEWCLRFLAEAGH